MVLCEEITIQEPDTYKADTVKEIRYHFNNNNGGDFELYLYSNPDRASLYGLSFDDWWHPGCKHEETRDFKGKFVRDLEVYYFISTRCVNCGRETNYKEAKWS